MSQFAKHLGVVTLIVYAAMVPDAMSTRAWSQVRRGSNSITGEVVDSLRGTPVLSADVFLRGTTKGVTTGVDGTYDLTNLPDGDYELIISMLGYERTGIPVKLSGSTHLHLATRLKPRSINVSQVVVTGSADEWRRLLPVFKEIFLGSTENAHQCTLVNPEVVSLSIGSTGDSLQAHTDSTLIVDNNALGYRVYVQIDSCVVVSRTSHFAIRWYPRYEEMKPRTKSEEEDWRDRRRECYDYSFRHFLRCAMDHQLKKNDFRVSVGELGDLLAAKGDEIDESQIRTTMFNDSSVIGVDFGANQLRIDRLDEFGSWRASMAFLVHPENPLGSITSSVIRPGPDFRARGGANSTPGNNEGMIDREPLQDKMTEKFSSIVRLKERPLFVDRTGNPVQAFSVVLNGYWGSRRLADTLPFDDEPEYRRAPESGSPARAGLRSVWLEYSRDILRFGLGRHRRAEFLQLGQMREFSDSFDRKVAPLGMEVVQRKGCINPCGYWGIVILQNGHQRDERRGERIAWNNALDIQDLLCR